MLEPLPDIFHRDADGEIRLAGHRIRLIDVAARYEEGHSPEAIVLEHYPTLALAQVYGALAFYLAHEQEVRELMGQNAQSISELQSRPRKGPTLEELKRRMEAKQRAEAS
jgi:uncharacterized protein (DUF433 family)